MKQERGQLSLHSCNLPPGKDTSVPNGQDSELVIKGKGKVHTRTGHEGPKGEKR